MQLDSCKSCGGYLERKGNYYVCRFCGSRWVIDADQDVHVIDRANAWSALRDCEFEHASELFENIILKDSQNHEAYWGRALANAGIMYVTDYSENKKVPTCNSISESSFIDSRDVRKAIELAPADIAESYKAQAEQIEAIRVEWVKKASREPAYDIFISYKDSDRENGIERTEDSYNAHELYMALTEAGYKVFFSRVSLRNKVSEHYEPYIYNAIKTAKVMVVYGEKPEYFNAVWIKNEWMRFRQRIEQGEKHKQSLVVAYKGLNPSDLPVGLRSRQCIDAASFTFLEDLKQHIAKIIRDSQPAQAPAASAPTTPAASTAAVPPAKSKGKTGKMVAVVVLALAVCVGAVLVLPKLGSKTPEEPPLAETALLTPPSESDPSDTPSDTEADTSPVVDENTPTAGITYRKFSGGQYAEVTGFTSDATDIIIADTYEGVPVTKIAQEAFREKSIQTIRIPASVTVIELGAFQFCENLTSVVIEGNALTTIMANAFEGCSALQSLDLPDTIQKIENSAFYGCDTLIQIEGGAHYVDNCVVGCEDDVTSVILREGTRLIADNAFSTRMTLKNLSIPQSVVYIGTSAFESCHSLETVVIPDGVAAIDEYTFIECMNLKTVSFGASVRKIGEGAFMGCESLTSIQYRGSRDDWERMDIMDANDVLDIVEIVFGK